MFIPFLKSHSNKKSKITVYLKNNTELTGNITQVDNNMNIVLVNLIHNDELLSKNPQLEDIREIFIRGNSIQYVEFYRDTNNNDNTNNTGSMDNNTFLIERELDNITEDCRKEYIIRKK